MIHFAYIIFLAAYIDYIYINGGLQVNDPKGESEKLPLPMNYPSLAFFVMVFYPLCYELLQMIQIGFADYITDFSNI